jgi:hypothetical protein
MTFLEQAAHLENTCTELAQRINTLAAEHAQAIASKDAEIVALQQAVATLETLKTTMETRVSTVLQSGDPLQYEALAKDFLTPVEEKERLEKLARLEALRAEVAALETQV